MDWKKTVLKSLKETKRHCSLPTTTHIRELRRKAEKARKTGQQIVQKYHENQSQQDSEEQPEIRKPVEQLVLEAELEKKTRELESYKERMAYVTDHYSASRLSEDVIRMATGLPTKEVSTLSYFML